MGDPRRLLRGGGLSGQRRRSAVGQLAHEAPYAPLCQVSGGGGQRPERVHHPSGVGGGGIPAPCGAGSGTDDRAGHVGRRRLRGPEYRQAVPQRRCGCGGAGAPQRPGDAASGGAGLCRHAAADPHRQRPHRRSGAEPQDRAAGGDRRAHLPPHRKRRDQACQGRHLPELLSAHHPEAAGLLRRV